MRQCDITGKRSQRGNDVSFSMQHNKRRRQVNLQTKRLVIDGKEVRLKISTQGIRILKKKGLLPVAGK